MGFLVTKLLRIQTAARLILQRDRWAWSSDGHVKRVTLAPDMETDQFKSFTYVI